MTPLFKPEYYSGVEDWLDENTSKNFLIGLGIKQQEPNFDFLLTLVQAIYQKIPFQNLTMLTRQKIPPEPDQIIEDMMSGIGGLCNTMNPFFVALLHQLGFKTGFIKASMAQPDCHIGVLVEISQQIYWIDLGNGFPYLKPLLIQPDSKAEFLGFEYKLQFNGQRIYLNQNILGQTATRINQHFSLSPCQYDAFDKIRQRHYSEAGFGPFLTAIRVNRWEPNAGFLLRDNIITNFPGTAQTADKHQITAWLKQNFDQSSRLVKLIKQSWQVLNDNSRH